MAYADQGMSTRKVVSIAIVALLHVVIGYAFITGLAINVIKKAATDLKVVDIKDQPPPPEQKPPPPPPEQKVEPPPIVAPPPLVQTQTIAPPIVSVPTPPPVVIHEQAPPAPPPPPRPVVSQAAGAKGDPHQWVSDEDYPPAAAREGRGGSVRISIQISEQGRVTGCNVTQSSGSPDIDDTTCRLITRRGRYSPAKDQSGAAMATTASLSYKWVAPKD
jgi:protein TonB